jgi:hyperosmotically inducible protein
MTMNRRITGAALVMIVQLGGYATHAAVSAADQAMATNTDDRTLKNQITSLIKRDRSLNGYKIDVDLNDGVVTLGGTVRTEPLRMRAQRLATIPGVKYVRNEIVVDPTTKVRPVEGGAANSGKVDTAAAKTKVGVDKGLDASKKGAEIVVDKAKEGTEKAIDATKKASEKGVEGASAGKDAGENVGRKIREAFADGALTAKVKAKIADDPVLKGSDIKVETADHVVTLKGTVASADGVARAEEIARGTDGVERVVNLLAVVK